MVVLVDCRRRSKIKLDKIYNCVCVCTRKKKKREKKIRYKLRLNEYRFFERSNVSLAQCVKLYIDSRTKARDARIAFCRIVTMKNREMIVNTALSRSSIVRERALPLRRSYL